MNKLSFITGKQRALRLLVALLGGYAFVWGLTVLLIAVQVAIRLHDFEDARALAVLLAFPVYAGLVLWSFSAVRLRWLVLSLFGGGMLMHGIGKAIQTGLVS